MLEAADLTALDAWIADQQKQVGRPEAIRTLLREVLPNPNTTTIRSEFGCALWRDAGSVDLDHGDFEGTAGQPRRSRSMPRYFLNLFNDQDVPDDEGTDQPDLAAAKAKAIAGARELMAEHVVQGRPVNLSHRIEVADEAGNVLATIPFLELITIVGN